MYQVPHGLAPLLPHHDNAALRRRDLRQHQTAIALRCSDSNGDIPARPPRTAGRCRATAPPEGIAARVAAGSMAGQDFGNLDQEVLKITEGGLRRLEED